MFSVFGSVYVCCKDRFSVVEPFSVVVSVESVNPYKGHRMYSFEASIKLTA